MTGKHGVISRELDHAFRRFAGLARHEFIDEDKGRLMREPGNAAGSVTSER
jgi:hypothetical protein